MLGRIGVLARRSSRFRGLRTASSVSALVAATGMALNWTHTNSLTITRMKEAHDSQQEIGSLVVPTLEASVRAWRLLRAAVLIVLDYELAKMEDMDLPLGWLVPDKARPQDDKKMLRRYWEEETERRRQELENAQIKYASAKDREKDTGKLKNEDPTLRKKQKEEEKKAVHTAAQRLGEAQDRLVELGDRKSIIHRKAANRLLQLCQSNGGVYIKIGQHLANLDYLIPNEFTEVLSSLFDEAPLTDYSDVCRVIEEDLGDHPDALFQSFDPEPIASASLAQVHVAIEKGTGRKLAVKVQHRGLRETSAGDLFALTTVVRTIECLFQDFSWGWVADEIAPQLPKELDFCNEARNSETTAAYTRELGMVDCVIPKVLWQHTSKRVLCMEFEEGFRATDVDAMEKSGLKKRDVAKLISSVFNAQVFLSAFVHCDPHPANVLIREKNGRPQMVLVDHGLYKRIDNDFRIRYAKLWKSLMMADLAGIKESCRSLGVDKMYTLLAAMLTSRPFDEIVERSKTGALVSAAKPDSRQDRALIQGYATVFLRDIFEILSTLPRQMLLLLKMNDCLRHIDYSLGSPTNTLVVAGNYAARAVYEDQIKNHSGPLLSRCKAWFDYFQVVVRIRLYELGSWWMQGSETRLQLMNK